MSRLIRIRDALYRLIVADEPRMRAMQLTAEREARELIPGPAHEMIGGWLVIARDTFETMWHNRVTQLLGEAAQIIDGEDRLIRVRNLAGPHLEELFTRYQEERVYHRLPRQAMSGEGFENYVIEMISDVPRYKRSYVGDVGGSVKRSRF